MPELLEKLIAYSLLIVGFGFVVFFHELGHFLAAKWVGIKVEQFAVGFGHAIVSWRKGMGMVFGASWKKLDKLKAEGKDVSQYGETEYRWNWIPLGGYVKMLGQDDMDATAQSDDPRSYNRKSIGARMFVVSAGVIMNVILAFIFFVGLFLMGFHVQPATVGAVQTNSPAQLAGLKAGDQIQHFDGKFQHDFTKLILNVALVKGGEPIPMTVERDGKLEQLTVRPARPTPGANSVYAIGLTPIPQLEGLNPKTVREANLDPKTDVLPGDRILAVNGEEVTANDYPKFDRILQASGGQPLLLTVQNSAGEKREVSARAMFEPFFGGLPFNIAGLQPRPVVELVAPQSPMKGKIEPGDIITALYVNGEAMSNPTLDQLITRIHKAGDDGAKLALEVERDGQRMPVTESVTAVRLGGGKRGLSVGLDVSAGRPVVAGAVEESAAARAGIPRGALIQSVNQQPVKTWADVLEALRRGGKSPATITYARTDGADAEVKTATLELSEGELQTLANTRYRHDLALQQRITERVTGNPFTAIAWGVTETRDLLLQFYLTLHRVTQGEVSVTNFMGPLGIVHSGSFFATRGWDWLIWFLAMISANLAVVNFLPIPIVDGGLFVFLILEKVTGKPLSPKMQQAAQLVGLAIILSVFVLVTYQDIQRIFL